MLDFYRFLTELSHLGDLDLLRPGAMARVDFQDVPDALRELLTGQTRAIPGIGIAPLAWVFRTLQDKGYAGPAQSTTIEPFVPVHQGDAAEPGRRRLADVVPDVQGQGLQPEYVRNRLSDGFRRLLRRGERRLA